MTSQLRGSESMTNVTVSSGDEVGETRGHGQCWHRHRGRSQEGEANSLSSAGQASQLPLLNLCHMPDPFINVHRQPHAASYGEVGAQPPPHPLTPRLCGFHFFICLFNFPIAEKCPAELRQISTEDGVTTV